MQLQAGYEQFEAAGIQIALITYDAEVDQARFATKHSIKFPFLSDVDRQSVMALGILNEAHQPGEMAYGVPHPGFYVLNNQGEIVAKSFLERYQQRLSTAAIFRVANAALNASKNTI